MLLYPLSFSSSLSHNFLYSLYLLCLLLILSLSPLSSFSSHFFPPLPFSHFLLIIVISCWKPSFLVHAHTLIHTEQFKQKVLICDEPSTSSQSSWSVMSALFQCCWCVERFCTQYFVEFDVSAWLVCTLLTFEFFIWTVVLKDSSSMYLYQCERGEVLICYKRDGTCQLDYVLTTTKGYSWSARLYFRRLSLTYQLWYWPQILAQLICSASPSSYNPE